MFEELSKVFWSSHKLVDQAVPIKLTSQFSIILPQQIRLIKDRTDPETE